MSHYYLSPRVRTRIVVLTLTAVFIIGAFPFNWSLIRTLLVDGRYPPSYPNYQAQELKLSHYKTYEHSDVKYLWSPNHPSGVGWGNIMQDYVLNYVLAYATNRSFVFDDYTWAVDDTPYSPYNSKLIPSRIPLNAFVDGPLAGGELPPGDNTPRAVHKDFFQRVCPNPTILQLSDVSAWSENDTVEFVFDMWADKINSIDDPCLQFEEIGPDEQIFSVWVFSQKHRLLSIWPYMSKLPMLSQWGWSSLIHDAFQANRHVVFPPALTWPSGLDPRGNQTLPNLLALHIRRGDFSVHCNNLASWNADWNAFNTLPGIPDTYDEINDSPRLSYQNKKAYVDHCNPSMAQIVEKVKTVREESSQPLTYLYIMTNGDARWVEELQNALRGLGGWEHIGSSLDLRLTWEQKYVAQAMDMMVAQKAEVFIGNGWSSLSSNVVMLRVVDGLPLESNRFW